MSLQYDIVPIGNLDGEDSRNVEGLLTQLALYEGYCVISITHDTVIAEAFDLVYRVADGVLKQAG